MSAEHHRSSGAIPMSRTAAIAAAGAALVLALVALVVVSGISLVPAGLLLGPCLPDWTSPNSYGRRASPLATVRWHAGSVSGELCYGRPSRRGRPVYGGLVPFDTLWRFGANEPTRLYLGGTVRLAGLRLGPGRYSLYVRPASGSWTLFASRSVLHWGNDISAAVRAREVGQAALKPEVLPEPVETLTVTAAATGDTTWLRFDWETTRVALPIVPAP
jgi:hypothetical protein